MRKHSLLLPLFLILSTSSYTATGAETDDLSGGDENCANGETLTMQGCVPTCSAGHIWCDPGQECIAQSDNNGFICSCLPGYYNDSLTKSCEVGRYFGGRIFFEETTAFALARSTDPMIEAESIVSQIYNSSLYYYKSSVLSCSSNVTCSYELIYQNAKDVDVQYVQDVFVNKTGNCSSGNDIATQMNCTGSRDSGFDQGIVCEPEGSFSDICDEGTGATCTVSHSGSFYCSCEASYALPYAGATSCTEIKCESDADCSGGGIHGACEVYEQSPADNVCQCNWGFTGNSCENPWWFIFTVLTGAFGLLAIVILVGCICMSTKTKTVKTDVQKDDLDLKNPFVDFQPGVRAKVSTNIYSSVTDSISAPTTQGHSNPAFNNNAYDEREKATPYSAAAQGNDYF